MQWRPVTQWAGDNYEYLGHEFLRAYEKNLRNGNMMEEKNGVANSPMKKQSKLQQAGQISWHADSIFLYFLCLNRNLDSDFEFELF